MKIALVVPHFAAAAGGGPGRNASDLALGLLDRGHDVHVVAGRFEPADPRLRWIPAPASGLHVLKPWSFARAAGRALAGGGFDVVHSFTRIFRCDIHFVGGGVHRQYLRQRYEGHPLAGLAARLNPKHWIADLVDRRSFDPRHCRLFEVLAERTREDILARYPIPGDRIRLVRIGIDLERFSPEVRAAAGAEVRAALGLRGDDLAALFVGSGWKTKGLASAIEAVARAAPWKLLVCGKGPEAGYRRLARRLGAEDRVAFLGLRTDAETVHAAADALVHPSLYDPFPNACLEALASGVPVLATRVTGTAEIIEDGREGFLIDGASRADQITARLLDLTDRARREAMGAAARKTAEAFPLSRYVEENLKLYEELRGQALFPAGNGGRP